MTRLLQGNLNRCALAQDLLRQRIFEDKIDICLICEQHLTIQDRARFADKSGTAAIWIANTKNITVDNSGSGSGFIWIKTPTTYFISVYLSPNEGIRVFRQKMADIEDAIGKFNEEVIVAGDFNAKWAEWGADFSDTRGNEVADFAARLDLIVLNTGNTTTFRRPGYQESILDITLATPRIANMIEDWTVSEEYSGSDHQNMTFSIRLAPIPVPRRDHRPRKWNARKLDLEALRTSLTRSSSSFQNNLIPNTRNETETLVSKAMEVIVASCDASMPRMKERGFHRPAYWCIQDIAELRKKCHELRRLATRAAKRSPNQDLHSSEYKQTKKNLNRAIKASKAKLWQEICNNLDKDIWDTLEHKFDANLENLAIVDDYLDERTLIAERTEGQQEHDITAGVPQGSIMGPDLWNADYDELLEIPLPKQVELTGFADDVAATIIVDSAEESELLVRENIDAVENWLEKHHLKLAKQKTEIFVLTRQNEFAA
ncbi:uncharacterized protein LOC123261396 [Cotesia glomerata]|uniref:uncharacterized protein LOC123261396 n=1 Tax=Cotesia glomerata TaxID=32391 RepID=UPI001D0214F9|nr:uncharacterized protein LOC123261396 [Cotesia glomerata]